MIASTHPAAPARRSALDNRRFRSWLLAIAGIPIVGGYLWLGILQPILTGYLGDFQESYMRAAGRLAAGLDPYDLCQTAGCLEPTGPQYVMPPVLAWSLEPLVGIDRHAIEIGVIVVLNLSLALFLWLSLKAIGLAGRKRVDTQLALLLVLVALAFEPTAANIAEGQVNLLLLGLSGVWLYGWVAGRWWGGVALGAAVAIKLIQGPVALLVLWARRWTMLAAAAATGLILWLAGAPQYLLEYLLKVLPAISQGTGLFENHSPGGTIARLFEADTFLGAVRGSPAPARIITLLVAVSALALTFIVLRSPAVNASGRLLEGAAVVAATPLVATYSWGTHLVLLLLPMFVLIAWAVPRRDWLVIGLVAASWLLIGPAHKWMQALLVSGYSDLLVLRLMAEFGAVGITAIWVASLVAVRRERSANRPDPAHEHGAHEKEDDSARKDDPVTRVATRGAVEVIDQRPTE